MPTIKDVAARAGVSTGTASRALSGHQHISADALARVLAASAELGYVTHGPARALRRARTDVIGLLVPDIRNPFFSDLAHAAERHARARGRTVLLANTDEDPARESEYLASFASQRLDGLLLVPQTSDAEQLRGSLPAGRPVVFVDRDVHGLEVPSVTSDSAGGVLAAVSHLHGRGHRRVAYVGGPGSASTAQERLVAFLSARDNLGLDPADELVTEGDFRAGSGARAVERLLSTGMRPTAVLVADGLMASGALEVLRAHPDPVVRTVELVSFDDLDWFRWVSPAISAVVNDSARVGQLGMQVLLDLVEGRDVTSHRVPAGFVDRSGGTS